MAKTKRQQQARRSLTGAELRSLVYGITSLAADAEAGLATKEILACLASVYDTLIAEGERSMRHADNVLLGRAVIALTPVHAAYQRNPKMQPADLQSRLDTELRDLGLEPSKQDLQKLAAILPASIKGKGAAATAEASVGRCASSLLRGRRAALRRSGSAVAAEPAGLGGTGQRTMAAHKKLATMYQDGADPHVHHRAVRFGIEVLVGPRATVGDALRAANDLRPMGQIVAEEQAKADALGSNSWATKRGTLPTAP